MKTRINSVITKKICPQLGNLLMPKISLANEFNNISIRKLQNDTRKIVIIETNKRKICSREKYTVGTDKTRSKTLVGYCNHEYSCEEDVISIAVRSSEKKSLYEVGKYNYFQIKNKTAS